MAGEWSEVAVSDVADLSGGFAFKSKDYTPSGRFILRTLNIRDDCSISRDDAVYLPEELCPQYARFELKPNDTLFVMVGATLGKVGYVRKTDLPALLNQNMWLVRAKQDIADPRFIHYAFRYAVKNSLGWASGSARDFVRRDDKIELNRRMNETLEAMAQAIFKSWFVDATENGIPKGWRVAALPEVVEINPPRQLSKGQIAPYLDMQNMPTHGHRPIDWINRPFGSGMRFKNGDTLVARITPCLENGKTAFVDFLENDQIGWGSTEYIVLRPKQPLPMEYGYYLARSEDFRNHAIQNMTGSSGRQRVPAECFSKYLIAVPSEAVAQRFGEVVKPLMETIRANDNQSRTLTALRDTLLPKLLSGEIRVKDMAVNVD